jgi:hypothetical protein
MAEYELNEREVNGDHEQKNKDVDSRIVGSSGNNIYILYSTWAWPGG